MRGPKTNPALEAGEIEPAVIYSNNRGTNPLSLEQYLSARHGDKEYNGRSHGYKHQMPKSLRQSLGLDPGIEETGAPGCRCPG